MKNALMTVNHKLDEWISKYDKQIFAGIVLIYFLTRLYRLVDVPRGFNADELGLMYDSWSMATDHTDRYRFRFPVYTINFGGGMSMMYTYISAVLIMIFGFSKFLVRLPAVFGGAAFLIFGYLLAKDLFKSKKAALGLAIIITICPVYFMSQRWALDSAILVDFLVASIYFFVKAIEKKKYRYFILTGLAFGATLYTYALSYIIIIAFLGFCFFYLLWMKKIKFSQYVVMGIPLGIMAIPLILVQLVNMGLIDQITWTYMSVPRLHIYRSSEITLANLKDNLYMLKNLFTFDWLPYTALPEFGTLYYISIPFVLWGLFIAFREFIKHIKTKEFHIQDMIVILFTCTFCLVMILDEPSISRALSIYFSLMVFLVIGLKAFYQKLPAYMPVLMCIYGITFVLWCGFYYYRYPVKYVPQILFTDCDYGYAIEYFDKNYDYSDKKVYIDKENAYNVDIETLLFTQTSTFDYERKEERINEYHLYLPKVFDPEGVYIVYEDSDFIKLLNKNGYKMLDSFKGFGLYVKE